MRLRALPDARGAVKHVAMRGLRQALGASFFFSLFCLGLDDVADGLA